MGIRLLHRIERAVVYYVIRLFRIRSATEQVARGFAVGLIPNFYPTFGFGFLISAFLARITGGSAAAGLVGGVSLAWVWPLLFFLNVRMGSVFVEPRIPIDDLEDVTERNMRRLMWGPAFMVGAILNGLLAGLMAYGVILAFYRRLRPGVLAHFRSHARAHQLRFRQWRQGPLWSRKGGR